MALSACRGSPAVYTAGTPVNVVSAKAAPGLVVYCFVPGTSGMRGASLKAAEYAPEVKQILARDESTEEVVAELKRVVPRDSVLIEALDYQLCMAYAKGEPVDYVTWLQAIPVMEVGVGFVIDESGTPRAEEFPNAGIPFRIHGGVEPVKDALLANAARLSWRVRQEISEPYVYIITVFIREPSVGSDRRIRRSAYRIRVSPHSPEPNCTDASVTWLTESKGIREGTWSREPADQQYEPAHKDYLLRMIQAQPRCP